MKLCRILAATAVVASLSTACTDAGDVGGVELALTGQSPSGVTYRLRDAQIDLAGSGVAVSFSTETDPTRTALTARVASGPYTLDLHPGWRLERIAADGTATNVDATLLSANPQSLEVVAGAVTNAALRFRAAGEDVAMGDGDVVVTIDVEDAVDAGVPEVDAAPVADAAPSPDAPLPPPSVTIVSGPNGVVAQTTVTFGFVYANGDPVCRVDAQPFLPCPTGTFTASVLANGAHVFEIRVDNAVGVVQTARSFTVDTIAPAVAITSAPAGPVPGPTVAIGFAVSGGPATTTCRVDAGAAVSCTSPFTTPPLPSGNHVVRIDAADAAGNIGIAQVVVTIL